MLFPALVCLGEEKIIEDNIFLEENLPSTWSCQKRQRTSFPPTQCCGVFFSLVLAASFIGLSFLNVLSLLHVELIRFFFNYKSERKSFPSSGREVLV